MTVSVVVSTHNRAPSLARTLASVKKLADEIIVVDSESSDDTVKTAKKFTPHVFTRPNNLMLNVNKNFGFGKATGDWILNLDDDEELTDDMIAEIRETLHRAEPETVGYWLPRKNIIFGKWIRHGLWWPDPQLRLFRRGKGKFPEKHVHEYVAVSGKTETLTSAFVHHNYDSVAQFLGKMEQIYIESELIKYEASGYRTRWQDAIRFPVSDFLKIYFAQSGYRDGLHGLVLAILQAFYSFVIFARLWERESFAEQNPTLSDVTGELRHTAGEYRYWMLTSKMQETGNPLLRIWYRILRRYGQ